VTTVPILVLDIGSGAIDTVSTGQALPIATFAVGRGAA